MFVLPGAEIQIEVVRNGVLLERYRGISCNSEKSTIAGRQEVSSVAEPEKQLEFGLEYHQGTFSLFLCLSLTSLSLGMTSISLCL